MTWFSNELKRYRKPFSGCLVLVLLFPVCRIETLVARRARAMSKFGPFASPLAQGSSFSRGFSSDGPSKIPPKISQVSKPLHKPLHFASSGPPTQLNGMSHCMIARAHRQLSSLSAPFFSGCPADGCRCEHAGQFTARDNRSQTSGSSRDRHRASRRPTDSGMGPLGFSGPSWVRVPLVLHVEAHPDDMRVNT